MTYRALFSMLIMSIFFCCYSPITIAAGAPKMNMQQMQDFERELEEANRAIEEYVSSLSPAEQAEFNKQVEEMSRMFENMSEDEFEKFLGEMFADEPMTEQNPFTEIQPIAQEVIEVTPLSAEDKKKVETALKVLDDIIKQSNLFMVLVNSSPELPNRITRWGTKGTISNWQSGTKWDSFKVELETLVQKLYQAEEQDLSKKYKYLFDLIADESLYNNLIQLQTSLNTLVPTINIPEFGVQKLTPQSKNTIKEILKKYTESFYLLGIPKALDALFEKYGPEAEKIRSAEDAANKRALESARGVRTPASPETAGVGSESMGYGYDYGYPEYYGGDYGYGYPQYYDRDYGYSPEYGYGSEAGGTGAGKGGAGGSGGGGSGGGGKGGEKEKEEKEDKGKREEGKFNPNLEIESAVTEFKSGLADIKAAMVETVNDVEQPSKLAKLADTIKNEKDVDLILAGSTLPKIVDAKLDAVNEAFKTIDKKKLNAADLHHYQGEVRKAFEKNKKDLEELSRMIGTFGTAEEIKKAKEEAQKRGISAEEVTPTTDIAKLSNADQKQWAYFGGEDTLLGGDEEKLEEKITSRANLFDIKEKIDTLLADMKKFMSKKSEIPMAPVVKKKEEPVLEETPDITIPAMIEE